MSSKRFRFPDGVRFECTRCGDCCRGWQIMLGPGERERLEALEWAGRADDLAGLPVAEKDGARDVLSRRGDGACIFLGTENQCRIHEHFGSETKPLMCRLFPFGFLPMGDSVAVDVSFYCRSVSEGQGRALEERIPEWTRLLSDAPPAGSHRFSKKYAIDSDLLWELEHHLLDLLREPSLTTFERVRALSEFVRLATTSDPTTDAARQLRRVMASGMAKLVRERAPAEGLDKTQRAIFFHLMFLMLNPTPDALRRASGKARAKEIKRRVQAADAYKFDQAHPWLDNRELDVSYARVLAVRLGVLEDDAGADLIERYLQAKIIGQRFMREGDAELPFVEAVPRLLVLYPMILWTAKALAAEDGADAVRETDARRAVRLLDRSYGEVRLSQLPSKARKAWQFILLETDLASGARREVSPAP